MDRYGDAADAGEPGPAAGRRPGWPSATACRWPGRRTARRSTDPGADADLVDRAVADLEGPGALPGPALPGRHLRRPGQRRVRRPRRCGGVHQRGVRRRHRRGDGRRRRRPGRPGLAVVRRRLVGARGGRPSGPGAGPLRDRAVVRLLLRTDPTATTCVGRAATRTAGAGRSTTGTTGSRATTTTSCTFFFGEMFNEPHSTKQIEDCVAWGREVAPQTLVDTTAGRLGCDGAICTDIEPLCAQVTVPGHGAARDRRPGPRTSATASGWPS